MKIIVDEAIPFIKGRFPEETDVTYLPGNEISYPLVKDADALIVRTRTNCNEDLLEGSTVKLVATATIGTDHIDLEWCKSKGIVVKSSPGCNAPGVAQYVFSSIFSLGFNPEKHTLGIIGYGHVGSLVAEWAKNMGIKILVNDPPRQFKGYDDFKYSKIDEILRESDAVTLHIPFEKNGKFPTFHLLGNKELGIMKPGALLVNTSRGGVVDEIALKKHLKSRKIKSILDVWENEPNIDTELLELVSIGTPHIAGYSLQGKMRGTRMVLEAVRDVLELPVDLSGLECIPERNLIINRELIEKSYNPFIDFKKLKDNASCFESLRNNYKFRNEPLFNFI